MSKYREKFLRDTYVDDLTTSFHDTNIALQFSLITEQHMKEGGFSPRKWESNNEHRRHTMKKVSYTESTDTENQSLQRDDTTPRICKD